MHKKNLIIIIILFLTMLLGVLVVGNRVRAEDKEATCPVIDAANYKYKCPPGDKENIRLQIAIPGMTDSCTYKVKTLDGEELKTCYYISANLPFYIKKLYSFAIGAIAIIAVIMIMIGGLQWIFAAGNPGTIGSAKTKITSAVAGLILALLSYVILNTINPSLTKLTMTTPGEIEKIEQPFNWCKDLPYDAKICIKGKGKCTKESDWQNLWEKSGNEYKLSSAFPNTCGIEYEIKGAKGKKEGELRTCYGVKCDNEKFCYQYKGVDSFCMNAAQICYETDDTKGETKPVDGKPSASRTSGCDKIDKIFQDQGLSVVCGKRYLKFSAISIIPGFGYDPQDICQLGEELKCDEAKDEVRVSCYMSDKCSVSDSSGRKFPRSCNNTGSIFKDMTYFFTKDSKVCIDEPSRGAEGVNAICCQESTGEFYCKFKF